MRFPGPNMIALIAEMKRRGIVRRGSNAAQLAERLDAMTKLSTPEGVDPEEAAHRWLTALRTSPAE